MSSDKKQTFMKGALILMIANILVKVIGAVFKIPLNYLIGDKGMGYFGSAYTVYNWLYIVATAGLPVAISKMVAESQAMGNNRQAHRIFSVSLRLLGIIGVAGFAFLYFGGDFCANLMGNPSAAAGIKALSPAILFVSLMSAYRGFFQGQQNMLPTAVSEVSEAIGKLSIGYLLALMYISVSIEKASAAAVFGVSAGGFFSLLTLMLMHLKNRKNILPYDKNDKQPVKSDKEILIMLVKIAVPITIGASVFSLTTLIDAGMIMRRLQNAAGIEYDVANEMWGAYTGKTITMFNLVPTLISAISISIVPTIASSFATKNIDKANEATFGSIKITILLTAPCAVGMAILAGPILQLLFHSTSAESTLSILGYGIVFVSLVSLTNAILQATGHATIPVVHMVIGGIVKIIVNYFLVGNPKINIVGAAIGTILCYVVILCLNLRTIKNTLNISYKVTELVIKPLVSVAAMVVVVLTVYRFTGDLGNTISTALSIVAGGITYVVVLFAAGGVTASDVQMLPKAEKLVPILKKFKLIKE